MAISAKKFLSSFYSQAVREKIKLKIALVGGPSRKIGLTFDVGSNNAYTSVGGKSKDKLLIHIGGGLVKQLACLPDSFTKKETIKILIPDIFKAFYGLVYHELGHDVYTDMHSTEISEYPEVKYRGFMHNMFNILEDVVIEFCMTVLFKKEFAYDVNPKVYFDFIIERMFKPQGETYEDDETQIGFMNYLLLFLRIGEKNIKNNCAIFDKYRKDLTPLLNDVLCEPDGTQRVHNTVVLCEWIIENIKEFDWTIPEPPEYDKVSGKTASSPGIPGSKAGTPMPGMGGGTTASSPEDSSIGGRTEGADTKDEKSDEEESPEESEEDEEEKCSEDEEEDESKTSDDEESKVEKEIDEDIYDEVFNDFLHDYDEHEWVDAKEEYEVKKPEVVDQIDEIINENAGMIREVSDYLTLFKGRIKPMRTEGMTSGRLSIRRAIRDEINGGCSTRLFQRKLARGKDADLTIMLVTDNSGSMGGLKSEICSKACIILSQACEWSHIPFEVNAFTKTRDSWDGISFTITEKGMNDSLETCKPFLAINSREMISSLRSDRYIPTFAGNSEEVNLYYIWQRFKKVKHKTKLMFVLCDGATTGSRDSLRKVVNGMEAEDNIIVIGIGILDSCVLDIYNNAKVFKTMEELDNDLAPYLIDTLSKYAK